LAKTLEDLKKSREIRKNVIHKYGDVPTSVWEMKYASRDGIFELDERKQRNVAKKRHESMNYDKNDPEQVSAFSISSNNVRGNSEEGGLSTFPPELVRRVVNYYSEPGEIVLDPMAGHNSRMQVTHQCQRHYIGYDVSVKFQEFNQNIADIITGKKDQAILVDDPHKITLYTQSSEKLNDADNSVDLVFTSPPYYKVEYYTDEPEQLYNSDDYPTFLARLKVIIAECFRVLKSGKYCVFNINDFRYNSKFYTYHADVIKIFEEVGFTPWDCIIVKWHSAIGACFASQVEDRKICAKMHEYLIVGKKP